ncbi:metal ABC transporter permease [Candidatus Albibeggiatoa sp. nov. NOAA]|uniref:metal ABC transporter permease n=1 Tax=Candidatus Albibeggiatoa sp. nov. NOAA TaxID=3162724 RepID=UPI0032F40E4B|nr:metal ABC transporter permease [Thiotrichaceae bacterium]
MFDSWLDPLFHLPLLTGLILTILLSLLGVYLRLREEWLAALGLAQLASAGALGGAAMGLPVLAGSALGASIGAAAKNIRVGWGNETYALMLLFGWSVTLLLAANAPHGEAQIQAFIDGQLYFIGESHLWTALVVSAVTGLSLPYWSPRLLRIRFFPDYFRANNLPAWHFQLMFDILCAIVLGVASVSMGLMAAFALVFIPAWLAFTWARGWWWTVFWAVFFGLVAYLSAFICALHLDQPFAPMLVACLLVLAGVVWAVQRIVIALTFS